MVLTRTASRSRQETLSSLSNPRRAPTQVVQTFQGFSARRASASMGAITELENDSVAPSIAPSREHPSTPTRQKKEGPPGSPGGGPPDDGDDGGDDDDLYGDNDDNNNNPFHADQEEPAAAIFGRLADAIGSLARRNDNDEGSSKAKVREPDPFDGTEPRKLRPFLVQCKLNFQARPRDFRSDRAKVTFAQSYLKGTALEWFEPDLLATDDEEPPAWLDDYDQFLFELTQNFGPYDPAGDAEAQLEQLHLRDGQRITKYIVEFNRLATLVRGWGDGALRRQFYNGLPARIKDEVCRQGKPVTLIELKTLAQTIDARYWERKGETSRETTHKAPSTTAPKASAPSDNTKRSHNPPSTSSNRPSKPSGSSTSTPDLSNKLGKDGKLTAEERKRRMDNRLCLFCGGPGHSARDCFKSTSRAAKARAATATTTSGKTPEAKPVASTEAKK